MVFIAAVSAARYFRRREFGLICELFPYLTGFWDRGIRPKRGKDPQKDGGGNYRVLPFTTPALTIPRRLRCFTICYESRRSRNRGADNRRTTSHVHAALNATRVELSVYAAQRPIRWKRCRNCPDGRAGKGAESGGKDKHNAFCGMVERI
jgi:hypothetical protein